MDMLRRRSMEFILTIVVFYFAAVSSEDLKQHKNYHLLQEDSPFLKCGTTPYRKVQPYIGNGKVAWFGLYPWIARLEIVKDRKEISDYLGVCGGAIINDKYVLTAAHCIDGTSDPKRSFVLLDEYDLATNPDCILDYKCAHPVQRIPVQKFIYPNNTGFGKYRNPDIGLVRLKETISYNDFALPVCLPFAFLDNPPRILDDVMAKDDWACCYFAGWGAQSVNETKGKNCWPTKLRATDGFKKKPCNVIYNMDYICGVGIQGSPCRGDSGGPLTLRSTYRDGDSTKVFSTLVGVYSARVGPCGSNSTESIYVNVTQQLKWILDNVEP